MSRILKVDWTGEPATRCAWCGESLATGASRQIGRVVCGACGSATTDPMPDAASLDAAYGDWYWPGTGKRFGLIGDSLLRRSRASMAGRIDEVAPDGPILDVGAGEGTLIDALKERGRPASGLERLPSREDIVDLPIQEVEGRFAAIVFWHSLEHLPDAGQVIEAAAARLLPGGVLIIAVPDLSSRQARWLGDRWLHLDLPRHLVSLTTASLTSGLRDNGLDVITVSRTRGGQNLIGWLDGLVAFLPGRLDLYQALRRKDARRVRMGPVRRAASILAGIVLAPVALACAAIEVLTGPTGSVYVEGRHD